MQALARWLWFAEHLPARAARAGLTPLAGLYHGVTAARTRAYEAGLLERRRLPLPSVGIGALTVGGVGKTPLASWFAGALGAAGMTPAILLRGYGDDEGNVHRAACPGAVVIEDANRRSGAEKAREAGADVLVLDDAFQRLDVRCDRTVLVVNADTRRESTRLLPVGPLREGFGAIRRADTVVVTRKAASVSCAAAWASDLKDRYPQLNVARAHLDLAGFRTLLTNADVPRDRIAGRRVLVSAGVGHPEALERQCAELGAHTRLLWWPDHHAYSETDAARVVHESAAVDYVVVTEKDATKLRAVWPAGGQEPLVGRLCVNWEGGFETITSLVDQLVSHRSP